MSNQHQDMLILCQLKQVRLEETLAYLKRALDHYRGLAKSGKANEK